MDGVTGRPKTMCRRTNVLGPLVPKLIVPCDTMSIDWCIPVIMHYTIRLGWCRITGMYQCRDIGFLGRFIQGTRDPRKLVREHIVPGGSVTPPTIHYPVSIVTGAEQYPGWEQKTSHPKISTGGKGWGGRGFHFKNWRGTEARNAGWCVDRWRRHQRLSHAVLFTRVGPVPLD